MYQRTDNVTYCRPSLSLNEGIMSQETEEEGNVGLERNSVTWSRMGYEATNLDTANSEFNKSTQHLATRNLIGRATDCALHQQTIVMGLIILLVGSQITADKPLTVICAPAKPELASRRTPLPPALRYTSIFPVSGWKPWAASSVVIRH
jgi:hypothetical protein